MQQSISILLNLETGTENEILPSGGAFFYVSPNRMLLARDDSYQLIIINSKNEIIKTIEWQEEWYAVVRWLDNDRLIIWGKDMSIYIFNYKTGDQVVYPYDQFLDQDNYEYGHFVPEFDDGLNRVVSKDQRENYVMLDMKTNLFLTKAKVGSDRFLAEWAPDYSRVAVAGYIAEGTRSKSEEIFLIDRDGKVSQVSNIGDELGGGYQITALRWSPDGRYIAYWYRKTGLSDYPYQLAVLDIDNQKMTNTCFITHDPNSFMFRFEPPIWSPDSQELVFESHYDTNKNRVILFNLKDMSAAIIAENMMPQVWMKNLP